MIHLRRTSICLALCAMAFPVGADTRVVAIDVGHSIEAPGAMGARGRMEFEFNRDLAFAIRRALEARSIATKMIGADGYENRLGPRPLRARGSAFFLSVHHDSVQPHFLGSWVQQGRELPFSDRFAGFSLFVSRRNPALSGSLRCASGLGEELRRAGFRPSLYHADRIPGEMKPFADRTNGVHYYDNLAVLKGARSPAVLLEAGVIVNRNEEQALSEPETRDRIARAVAAGVVRCLDAGNPRRPAPDPDEASGKP
jgi:N-acetylmuramoyl-L-alanine amidase